MVYYNECLEKLSCNVNELPDWTLDPIYQKLLHEYHFLFTLIKDNTKANLGQGFLVDDNVNATRISFVR